MNTKKFLIVTALLALVIYYRQPLTELLSIISDQEAVSAYLKSYGALGPIVLFVLLVAQVFVAFMPGHALMVTAGYVYGTTGLFVVITSTILGSQVAFFIARNYGRDLIYKLAPPQIIQRWDGMARNQGVMFYFFSFVLPIFPSDLMCYVAGLGKISPRKFLVANILGRSVVAISITLIGMYGLNPPHAFWLIVIGGMVALFIGWIVFKKRKGMEVEKSQSCQASECSL